MVKITFKTVQNKLFTVDAEGSETVADVKKKIQETQSFPSENQKLIYSGKILNDAATVGSLNIKEKDFIVVMVSKPKAVPAAAPSTPAPAPAPAAVPAASTPAAPAPSSETPAAPASSTETPDAAPAESAPAGSGFGDASFVTGPALQQAIDGMVEMGFPRDQVQKALRASFNNPDRAVEYLMSGNIPSMDEGPSAAAAAAPPAAAPATTTPAPDTSAPAQQPSQTTPGAEATTPGSRNQGSAENLFAAAEAAMNRDRGLPAAGAGAGAAAGAGAGAGAGLAALGNSPVLQQLRQMVRENPAMIQPLLQRLIATSPQIAQLINQNPQALYDLLGAGGEGDDGEGDDDMMGQPTLQINLTQEEAAAVERLEALGFDRAMVLQAYMACDKNEELAANFLFENGDDDEN